MLRIVRQFLPLLLTVLLFETATGGRAAPPGSAPVPSPSPSAAGVAWLTGGSDRHGALPPPSESEVFCLPLTSLPEGLPCARGGFRVERFACREKEKEKKERGGGGGHAGESSRGNRCTLEIVCADTETEMG
eukprot:Cvel_24820.t1-p1 / transcript=Cvel_24820.t1 / gene=Cvel_24820 / organism=Chromera_velia_CCMP2878 / gene_product=hypothetical protein / transcript_product=hypothetical protein / location=Cvel_scaffold2735:24003-24396(+) / protein_length=131 / sequence_SO=supercontig / SO=protein_coding / is_pseudo=false